MVDRRSRAVQRRGNGLRKRAHVADPGWTRETGPLVRRRRRRRTLLRSLLAVALIAMVAGGVWLLAFSSVFNLRTTRVEGVQGAAVQTVLDTAALPTGLPLSRVDTGAATAAVAQLPWVGSVTATRRWPDTIVLTVTAREPVAVQATTGEGIDREGRTFAPVSPLPTTLIEINAPDAALPAAVQAWLALPPDLAAEVRSVGASSRDDIVFRLVSGSIVRWGSAGEVELKSEVLRLLMREPAQVYNVSSPLVPTVIP